MLGTALGAAIVGGQLGPVSGRWPTPSAVRPRSRRRPSSALALAAWAARDAGGAGRRPVRGAARGRARPPPRRRAVAHRAAVGRLRRRGRPRAAAPRRARRGRPGHRGDVLRRRRRRGARQPRRRAPDRPPRRARRRAPRARRRGGAARRRPLPERVLPAAVAVVAATCVLGVLWVPSMALIASGADAVGLDQGFAAAGFSLAWAAGYTAGAAGGGALAGAGQRRRALRRRGGGRAGDAAPRGSRRVGLGRYGPRGDRRRARARPRGLQRALRPAADPRPARGGRPARGRAGRRRPDLPRPPRGPRRARPRGRDRVPRAHRGAARAEVAAACCPREDEELLDLEPDEAAEELLARMLEARRYRAAAEHLAELLADEDGRALPRAPLPAALRAATCRGREARLQPRPARRGDRRAAAPPAAVDLRHSDDPARDRRRAPGAPARAAAPRRAVASTTPCAAPTA